MVAPSDVTLFQMFSVQRLLKPIMLSKWIKVVVINYVRSGELSMANILLIDMILQFV